MANEISGLREREYDLPPDHGHSSVDREVSTESDKWDRARDWIGVRPEP